jgi:hypothetical protein
MSAIHHKEIGRIIAKLKFGDIPLLEAATLIQHQINASELEAYRQGGLDAAEIKVNSLCNELRAEGIAATRKAILTHFKKPNWRYLNE